MSSAGAASQPINLDLLAWGGFCPSLAILRCPTSQKPSGSMLSSRFSALSRKDQTYQLCHISLSAPLRFSRQERFFLMT
ncbi:hypothetical protein DESA109040_07665 [Deinococcus saxicola]